MQHPFTLDARAPFRMQEQKKKQKQKQKPRYKTEKQDAKTK